jgi:hypothetical protein
VRKIRTPGSVRGLLGNRQSYRDHLASTKPLPFPFISSDGKEDVEKTFRLAAAAFFAILMDHPHHPYKNLWFDWRNQ